MNSFYYIATLYKTQMIIISGQIIEQNIKHFALSARFRTTDCNPYRRVRSPPPKACPRYGTKLYMVVKLYSWSSGECEVLFHCHYFKVHSDLVWKYLLGSHLWVK